MVLKVALVRPEMTQAARIAAKKFYQGNRQSSPKAQRLLRFILIHAIRILTKVIERF